MSRIVRIVVIWLVAVALPLQAFASITGSCCIVGHATTERHGHAEASGTDAGAVVAHHHAMVDEDAADDPDDADHRTTHDAAKGSPCGVCASCATTALSPMPRSIASVVDGFAVVIDAPVPPFLTAGPERPPRPFPS